MHVYNISTEGVSTETQVIFNENIEMELDQTNNTWPFANT